MGALLLIIRHALREASIKKCSFEHKQVYFKVTNSTSIDQKMALIDWSDSVFLFERNTLVIFLDYFFYCESSFCLMKAKLFIDKTNPFNSKVHKLVIKNVHRINARLFKSGKIECKFTNQTQVF